MYEGGLVVEMQLRIQPRVAEIVREHDPDQLMEPDVRPPSKALASLGRIAAKLIDFRQPEVPFVDADVAFPVETDETEGGLNTTP